MNNKKSSFFRMSSGPGVFLTFLAAMFYLSFYTSCANMGQPTGGDKDSIPPVVLQTLPDQNALNAKPKQVHVIFDEYVQLEGLYDKLVISPPLEKSPTIKMKGKSIVIKFNEELRDSTTYTVDFKNSIADNNEKNVLQDYRLSFSTGPTLDTLRIVGFVKDAFNLEPVEGSYVFLYESQEDSMVTTTKPDYVAKTNAEGFFMFSGLPQKEFSIYSVDDSNKDLKLDPRAEKHAFLDHTITPSATFLPDSNIQVEGMDTLLIYGHVRFQPDPVYFMQYEQKVFLQTLDDYKREERQRVQLFFTEPVPEDFKLTPVNFEPKQKDWYYLEASDDRDSLDYWITDTLISQIDTLEVSVRYLVPDSLFQPVERVDTLDLFFEDVVVENKKDRVRGRRKKENIEKKVKTVNLSVNAGSKFDYYKHLEIEAPDPVKDILVDSVHLTQLIDTTYHDIDFKFYRDSASRRKYIIEYPWEPEAKYNLKIDSATTKTIYDVVVDKLDASFDIRESDYYGRIEFTFSNVDGPIIVQLIQNSEEENVLYEQFLDKDGVVEFPNLAPQKLMVKVIYDRNNNGVWDSGNLEEGVQPENVLYWANIIRVRSNWDIEQSWRLPEEFEYQKDVFDPEAEAEKAKKDLERERSNMKAF